MKLSTEFSLQWLNLGRVGRPFGVHGAFVVHWLADLRDLNQTPSQIRLRKPNGDSQLFQISHIDVGGRHRVTVQGITSPEEARTWCHADVEIERDLLAPTEDGECYLVDLLEFEAFDEDRQLLGLIVGFYDHGATPLFALQSPDGQERLVPLLEKTLRRVDRVQRQVTLRVPEALW